jgi:hypothetical protein
MDSKKDDLIISKKISEDMFKLTTNGSSIYSWPLSSLIISDVFSKYFIPYLTTYLDKNINNIKLFELRAYLIMFLNRNIDEKIQKKYFRMIVNRIKEINVDSTFIKSLELKSYNLYKLPLLKYNKFICNKKTYFKISFLLNNLSEVLFPIFRGVGFEIFTKKNLLYKFYYINDDIYVLVSKYDNFPKLSFFGHVFEKEEINSFLIYKNNMLIKDVPKLINNLTDNILKKKKEISFENNYDRINYTINRFLYHINNKKVNYTKEYDLFLQTNNNFNPNVFLNKKKKIIENTKKYIMFLLSD